MFSLFYKKGTKNLLSQKKYNKIMKKRKGKIKRTVEIRESENQQNKSQSWLFKKNNTPLSRQIFGKLRKMTKSLIKYRHEYQVLIIRLNMSI